MILDEVLKTFARFLSHGNDDFIDRFHYLYTVIGLSVYMFFVTSKQYLGDPLTCMPSTGGDLPSYAHSMCWINGTYHFEFKNNTHNIDPTKNKPIKYYQWIIFILFLEIALFTLPSLIWNFFIRLNGFDMIHVTKNVIKNLYRNEYNSKENWMSTQRAIEGVADHVRMSFLAEKKSSLHKKLKFTFSKSVEDSSELPEKAQLRRKFPNLKTKPAFPIFFPYLLIKLVYIANIVVHYYLLSFIFDIDYFKFGIETSVNLMQNNFNFLNHYFPKRSFCDVQFFTKFVFNQYTVLCSLPLNLFNEIFYFGFWFWLAFIGALTVISLFYWLLLLAKPYRRRLVLNALQINETDIKTSYIAAYYLKSSQVKTFDTADSFLLQNTGLTLMENFELFFVDVCSIDVIFAVRLIAFNSNPLAMRDIFNNLWEQYLDLEDMRVNEVKRRPHLAVKRANGAADEIENRPVRV